MGPISALNDSPFMLINISGIYLILQIYICFYLSVGTNIAFEKRTKQSSQEHSRHSEFAVDGDFSTNVHTANCAHTEFENQPWWVVDLGRIYTVTQVVVYGRTDCCGKLTVNVFFIQTNYQNYIRKLQIALKSIRVKL